MKPTITDYKVTDNKGILHIFNCEKFSDGDSKNIIVTGNVIIEKVVIPINFLANDLYAEENFAGAVLISELYNAVVTYIDLCYSTVDEQPTWNDLLDKFDYSTSWEADMFFNDWVKSESLVDFLRQRDYDDTLKHENIRFLHNWHTIDGKHNLVTIGEILLVDLWVTFVIGYEDDCPAHVNVLNKSLARVALNHILTDISDIHDGDDINDKIQLFEEV